MGEMSALSLPSLKVTDSYGQENKTKQKNTQCVKLLDSFVKG